jgi:hypothetical protein
MRGSAAFLAPLMMMSPESGRPPRMRILSKFRPQRKEDFFFEKKKQKTFDYWAESIRRGRSQMDKSFLVLFFKKELLKA